MRADDAHAVYQYSASPDSLHDSRCTYTYKISRLQLRLSTKMLFSAITFCAQSAKPRVQWPRRSRQKCVSQFAQRLKDMRTQRGFDRARYFAKSLGIEENRYTRYERAEVEPSLTLIHKMCETLRVSPNELLGFAELGTERPCEPAPGLAEARGRRACGADGERHRGRTPSSSLAWQPRVGGRRHPPRAQRQIRRPRAIRSRRCARPARCFAACRHDPFGTVAEIVDDRGAEGRRREAQGRARRAYPGLHREHERAGGRRRSARRSIAASHLRISPPVALPTAAIDPGGDGLDLLVGQRLLASAAA